MAKWFDFLKKSIYIDAYARKISTYNGKILSNSILRPDQIYTVEMADDEGSRVYRFSEEQPRVAQNLEKMYLSGVFGGIPEYETDQE